MSTTLGIMDWGIGGLSVYQQFRFQNKTTNICYLSDSGFTPYGKLSKEQMQSRFENIADFFKSRQVSIVFVACNAASSALDGVEQVIRDVRFISLIPFGVTQVQKSQFKHVAVIGGDLTISSKSYERYFSEKSEKKINYVSAQPLSALVEAGELSGEHVEQIIRKIFTQLGSPDCILLACTHYPALIPTFKKLYPHLDYLDPAVLMAASCDLNGENQFQFYTTGSAPETQKAARAAFHIELNLINSVNI